MDGIEVSSSKLFKKRKILYEKIVSDRKEAKL